jgi:carboxyl-terminal processing protease
MRLTHIAAGADASDEGKDAVAVAAGLASLTGAGLSLVNVFPTTLASIFIAHGTIMSAEERGQAPRVYMTRDDAIAPHIPMVVLVDHGAASAAEIVTAALQDSGRAEVVGTQTYGKGVFQVTEPLLNGGALDITVGKYFTPNGRNIGGGGARPGTGIEPNIHALDNPHTPADEALTVAERTVAAEGP